ncbi:BlaI/MecI/CopY family transcriptional regulator [Actinocorallia longicatena]|uniref:BlaI/MecI/CopY family transcriptional regulator n=1 Tax=Actinocorallia longicatena TaxID=111803 RepID=A0ABP6Q5F5_9ACTN
MALSRRPLGQLEAEVLAAVAAGGPISAADVVARIPGEPAYTTINTILFRLHDKGMLARVRDGRQFLYRTAVDEARVVADRMHDHLRHASDSGSVLNRFVQSLSPEEELELRRILAERGAAP